MFRRTIVYEIKLNFDGVLSFDFTCFVLAMHAVDKILTT